MSLIRGIQDWNIERMINGIIIHELDKEDIEPIAMALFCMKSRLSNFYMLMDRLNESQKKYNKDIDLNRVMKACIIVSEYADLDSNDRLLECYLIICKNYNKYYKFSGNFQCDRIINNSNIKIESH